MDPGVPEISWSSERTLRVVLGTGIDPATQARVHAAYALLRATTIAGLVDVTPAYATVSLAFDVATVNHKKAEHAVRNALQRAGTAAGANATRTIEIPVDYGGEHGPDLADVARHCQLSHRDVVERHAAAMYGVCFLGFAPGFAYLAGLPSELATARLASPRTRVPAGAVAIGGGQTAVYPGGTPGGWRIIGRARVRVFDAGRDEPALLHAGDRVRFVAASFAETPATRPGGPA